MFGKMIQVMTAGVGFYGGFLWAVSRWAGGAGEVHRALLRAAVVPGALVAGLYLFLVAGLFWRVLPSRAEGLRMIVSPAAFTLSLALGSLATAGVLGVLGG